MKVLGHRGVVDVCPQPYQNTVEAFKLALKSCDGFETDVCVSADGELFLMHESTSDDKQAFYVLEDHLDEASQLLASGRRLDQMPAYEIAKLRTLDGSAIPNLKDVLSLFTNESGKTLNLELKGYGVAKALVPVLQKVFEENIIQPQQVMLTSFNHPELLIVRKALPHLELGFLMGNPQYNVVNMAPWHQENKGYYQPLCEDYMTNELFDSVQPEWIVFPSFALSDDVVNFIKKHHPAIKIGAWVYSEIEPDRHKAALKLFAQEDQNPRIDLAIVDTPHKL